MTDADTRADCISQEVRSVTALNLPVLRAVWRARWGEPPRFRSRGLLARAMAYKIQAEAYGDLPSAARRRAADYAEKFAADRRFTPVPGIQLKPGSSLIREWKGVRHELAVTATGFAYLGKPYRSLSEVAKAITGTKWNGPLFFGLRQRGGKAR